jgi:hypothetical protein
MSVDPDRNNITRSVAEWTVIVDTISKHNPRAITFRDTDHEYRGDSRDIETFGGKRVDMPMTCLSVDVNAKRKFLQDLLNYYFKIKDSQ